MARTQSSTEGAVYRSDAVVYHVHLFFCVFAYRKIEKPPQTNKHKPTSKKGNCMVKLNKTDQLVLDALKDGEQTLQELVDKTGEKSKKIFKSLRKLFENELIETNARKYKLTSTK